MGKFSTESYLMARETLHGQISKEVFDLSEFDTQTHEDQKRISIDSLAIGDAVTVRTCNSRYRMVVLNPAERKILIGGGKYFQQPAEACLLGSAIGKKIQIGHIMVGRGLGFSVGRRCFITSPIEDIEREQSGTANAKENGAA
jgi:hypothetical protein